MKKKIGIWMYRNEGGLKPQEKLVQILTDYGYEVVNDFDMRNCYALNGKVYTEDGRDLTSLDLFFHMNFDERSQHQNDMLHALDMAGVKVFNPYLQYEEARDKFASNLKLLRAGVNAPPSALIGLNTPKALIKKLFQEWGSLLIKERRSAGGRSIVKVDSFEQFMDLYEMLTNFCPNFFLQKFIAFTCEHDYRVEIVDGDAFSFQARRNKGSFKTNVHSGGTFISIPRDEKIAAIAKSAAAAIGIPATAVDLIKSSVDNEYYVLEVNDSLGMFLEGWEQFSGIKPTEGFLGKDDGKSIKIAEYINSKLAGKG
jgi:ribosomal protein S6--L-glutamate ligase